jgi:hypothetical protein
VDIAVTNIDAIPPTIVEINKTPLTTTNGSVTLTVTATDDNLHDTPYSFDNGKSWQTSDTKEFTKNQTGIILIRDKAGNQASEAIEITNIDPNAITSQYPGCNAPDIKISLNGKSYSVAACNV